MTASGPFKEITCEILSIAQCAVTVWGFIPPKRRLILSGAAVLMAVSSATNIFAALLLGRLVDTIQSARSGNAEAVATTAATILALFGSMYFVREGISVLRRAMIERSCTRINQEMQLRLVNHVLRLELQQLGAERTGALHARILRSVEGLVRFVRLLFLDFVPALLTGTLALSAALFQDLRMGMLMALVAPLSVYLTLRQLNNQKGVRLQLMRDSERIDGIIVEQLNGAEYLRVANSYERELTRLNHELETRRRREVKHHFEMSLYGSGKAVNEGIIHVSVLAMASFLALRGSISVGEVLAFSVLFLNVMAPLNEIHRMIDEGHEASLRLNDYLDLLRKPEDQAFRPVQNSDVGQSWLREKSAIVFSNVEAGYRSLDGKVGVLFRGLSLQIANGESIGVAGPSGSGKSTWIKILLRLLHPASGEISVAGMPIESVGREWIAENVGYVGQSPFVFSGTIRENIAYASQDADLNAIQQAAIDSGIHDEILRMPLGYESHVDENGRNLSGGQRQRLALARLLLKNPPIMILDEATSALDNVAERHVQQSIARYRAKRSPDSDRLQITVLIAHRLSTLRHCDRIFVFERGALVEVGSYDRLLEQNGLFTQLVKSAESPNHLPI